MRTLTVKEAAQALGVSVRTVQHRLNTGELKGKRTPNQYGVSEWRVWPNKEIMERLSPGKSFDEIDFSAPQEEFQGGDSSAVIDAEAVESERDDLEEPSLRTIVRELTSQFAEQLSREKSVVAQLQRELEDKDRQLKLLPDFQKQAEDQRKDAELKELQAIALQKQVEALQEQEEKKQAEIARLAKVEAEVLPSLAAQKEAKESELAKLQSDLEQARAEKDAEVRKLGERLAQIEEDARRKLADVQTALEEKDAIDRERIQETQAIKEQLSSLTEKLQEARKPWYKKLFSPST